eukprot:4099600-Pleurochrysis_carterae.AAC.1
MVKRYFSMPNFLLLEVADCIERILTVVVQYLSQTRNRMLHRRPHNGRTSTPNNNFHCIEVTTCTEPVRSRSSAAHASIRRSQKASAGR